MTPAERLEWQGELDSAMTDIDSRLLHPRRRATDQAPPPSPPELGQVNLTAELLDEIAWRVAEQMRHAAAASPAPSAPVTAAQAARPARPAMPPPSQPPQPVLREGKMLAIRVRWPIPLPWPLRLLQRKKRRHPLTTARVSA